MFPASRASSRPWWRNLLDRRPAGEGTRRPCTRWASGCWSSSPRCPAWWSQWRCPPSMRVRVQFGRSEQGWRCWAGSWGSSRWSSAVSSGSPGSWGSWSARSVCMGVGEGARRATTTLFTLFAFNLFNTCLWWFYSVVEATWVVKTCLRSGPTNVTFRRYTTIQSHKTYFQVTTGVCTDVQWAFSFVDLVTFGVWKSMGDFFLHWGRLFFALKQYKNIHFFPFFSLMSEEWVYYIIIT